MQTVGDSLKKRWEYENERTTMDHIFVYERALEEGEEERGGKCESSTDSTPPTITNNNLPHGQQYFGCAVEDCLSVGDEHNTDRLQ